MNFYGGESSATPTQRKLERKKTKTYNVSIEIDNK